jgi:hypothetical protein
MYRNILGALEIIGRKLGYGLDTAVSGASNLFFNAEQGVWYDPSDFSTLFQDSAGTTPVTAVEQPVGKILDKSGRGNHATQATAASRPVLSARVNLLLASATMSTQNVTTTNIPYTLQFTGTGTVTLSGTSTAGPLVGGGTLTFTPTGGTLTLTVTGSVTVAQLETGSTATRYQSITTATSYDTVGFKTYLKFDGIDDSLSTGSIDFTSTDKMTVFAGVRKLSDAAAGILAELSAVVTNNNGSFTILAPRSSSLEYGIYWKGTVTASSSSADYADLAAPITNVIEASLNLAGATQQALAQFRSNGINRTLTYDTTNLGVGKFGNYPLYIGRRGGTSLPFNGHLYSLIIRGAQSTVSQIASAESYVNSKTGAY